MMIKITIRKYYETLTYKIRSIHISVCVCVSMALHSTVITRVYGSHSGPRDFDEERDGEGRERNCFTKIPSQPVSISSDTQLL